MLVLQLPSWAVYRDWAEASTIEMWPGGPTFAAFDGPIIEYDDVLRRQEEANPESFAVEMRAQWRSSQFAYLPQRFVDSVFADWSGLPLRHQRDGHLGVTYVAAGDPSVSQANFGFTVGHVEYDAGQNPHVVFDLLHAWRPGDYPDHTVDYRHIEDEIFVHIRQFGISELTFDHVQSAGMIQRLQARADMAGLPKRIAITERRATAQESWDRYETFKTAIGHGIAPAHPLARDELGALQVVNGKVTCPTTGPTRTKDIVDAMVNVVFTLIGNNAHDIFERLARLPLGATYPASPPPVAEPTIHEQLSALYRAGPNIRGNPRGQGYNPARGDRRPGGRGTRWR